VLVELAYLKSYESMGVALVRCEEGCTCEDTHMDGHHTERNSQVGGGGVDGWGVNGVGGER
jgi:DNA polymerase alpha subunit B